MRRWTTLNRLLMMLAVVGTLWGPSLSSPLPQNTLCNLAGGSNTPNDRSDPTKSTRMELNAISGARSLQKSQDPAQNPPSVPLPAVLRLQKGDLHQPGREAVSYAGYKLLRTDVEASQLPVVDSLDTAEGVDLWSWRKDERSLLFEIDLLTPPAAEPKVKRVFTENNLRYQEVIKDLQDAINQQTKDDLFFSWNRPAHPVTWEKYHSYDEMEQYLDYLRTEYPHLVTLEEIGHSFENRSLRVAKVSTGANRTAIWIDGGIHAREWITPAAAMFILHRLVEGSWEVPELINNFDWYILPMANPDGYEYSRHHDRLWRKTRSINPEFPDCVGVDPNRNFGYKWAAGGSSMQPCSSIYHGPEPFSEPETRAIRDFLLAHKDQLKVYMSLHSYSQLWLTPWGHSKTLPSNNEALQEVGRQAVAAIKNYNGTEYTLGSVTSLLYVASGSSMDYALAAAGIPYSFTLELRDRGRYGFLLPKEEIRPTGEETFEGVRAMATTIFHQLFPGKQFS